MTVCCATPCVLFLGCAVRLCPSQALIKRYPEILRNLRPLPASLDVRDVPRSSQSWLRQRRRQQPHWLAAAAAVLPVSMQPGPQQPQQPQVKQQQGLPSQDELLVSTTRWCAPVVSGMLPFKDRTL